MKRNVVIVLCVLLTAIILSACGSKENMGKEDDSGKIKVGFSQQSTEVAYRIMQTESIKQAAEKSGYQLVFTDAQNDTAKQTSDVEDLVSQKIDYLALSPRDFEGAATALAAAKKAGIPVILIDRLAAGVPGEDYVAFIGSDYIWEGEQAAEWIAKKTDGKAKIVELTGTVGASAAKDRSVGFHQVVDKHPDMEVIVSQTADFSRAEAQKVMENIIQARGNEIDAVYAHNDEMAIGASLALKAAGYKPGKDILIVGIDGDKAAFDLIKAGEYSATIFSSPYFGPLLFEVIDNLVAGKEVEQTIILPGDVIDADNIDEKMDLAY